MDSQAVVKQTAAYRRELLTRYLNRVELQDQSRQQRTDWHRAHEIQRECELLEKLLYLEGDD